ncbi:MAG: type II toxin-antitoxin system HicB family antitoxin [Desulfococcus multivorans]|jgi:predicted RNase H-like HicB family nuclease|nr:type II toxin-antitoxin system HicB family antitoxin [Desulfococcus multivorans]
MNKIIKADIYYDGEFYCGRCIDFDVFTQGKTLDELTKNLKEAIRLHFEDDPESFKEKTNEIFVLPGASEQTDSGLAHRPIPTLPSISPCADLSPHP